MAKRIQELRESCGLSRQALGEMLGVSYTSVGKWERAESEPTGTNIHFLSLVLNTSVAYIVEGKSKADKAIDFELLSQSIADVEQAASILKHDYTPKDKAAFIVARYNLGAEPPFSDVLAIFDKS